MKNLLEKITAFFCGGNPRKVRYKSIECGRHARRRMKWRSISEEDVKQVLNNPDQIVALEENKWHACRAMGSRNIRVTYRISGDELIVLTAVDKSD